MKRADVDFAIALLLLASLAITGVLGYVQAHWDLRRFIPHRYFAYATLCLAAVHVVLNGGKMWRFLRRKR